MTRRQLLMIGFLPCSMMLGLWLFGNWHVYGMARFDCADRPGNIDVCTRAIEHSIEIKIAVALVLWTGAAAFLWKKA